MVDVYAMSPEITNVILGYASSQLYTSDESYKS
jgi:hypothetical protein